MATAGHCVITDSNQRTWGEHLIHAHGELPLHCWRAEVCISPPLQCSWPFLCHSEGCSCVALHYNWFCSVYDFVCPFWDVIKWARMCDTRINHDTNKLNLTEAESKLRALFCVFLSKMYFNFLFVFHIYVIWNRSWFIYPLNEFLKLFVSRGQTPLNGFLKIVNLFK